MKNRLKFIFFLSLAVILASCSDGTELADIENPNEIVIRPSAGIISPGNGDLRVGFTRVDENINDYKSAELLYATWKGALSSTAATALLFDQAQYYQPNGDNTSLIGFYPADELVKLDSNRLTIPFDAHTDVLLTDEVTANKTNKFGTGDRNFVFKHKLAALRFHIYISSADAAMAWGQITDIELFGQSDTLYVDLPSTVSFSSPADTLHIARRLYDDNSIISYPFTLPTTVGKANAVQCGYAIVAPFPKPDGATTAGRLQIAINYTLNNHPGKIKTGIAWPTSPSGGTTGFDAGKVYDVYFRLSATQIETEAIITEWSDGGSVDILL